MKRNVLTGIDAARIIAALLVIASHTAFLSSVSFSAFFFVTEILARLVIPFFALTSGFFLIRHYAKDESALYAFLKKTGILYAICILAYLPFSLYNGAITIPVNLTEILRLVFLDGTMYHLWYLPAVMIGACIAWFSVRKLGFGKAFLFTGILFVIGVGGDSYAGITKNIPVVNTLYDTLYTLSEHTRNGLFFTPVFLVCGGLLHEHKVRLTQIQCLIGFVFSFLLLSAESSLLYHFFPSPYHTMFLSQIPCIIFLFQILRNVKVPITGMERNLSEMMYLVHPMMIVGIRLISRIPQLAFLKEDPYLFSGTALLSVTAGIVYAKYHLSHPRMKSTIERCTPVVNTNALRHNIRALRSVMHEDSEMMAVVKADGYGHDAFLIASEAEKAGIHSFAAATVDEAIALRKYGITGDILILGYTDPTRSGQLVRYNLIQTLISLPYAKQLSFQKRKIRTHIAVDTGMHRIGVDAQDSQAIRQILAMPYLKVEGIFTHLCAADSTDETDVQFTQSQISRFDTCLSSIPSSLRSHLKTHVQSSAGLLNYPDLHYDMVRVGISLYGISDERTVVQPDLKPVLSIHTKIVLKRDVKARETIGYGRTYTCEKDSVIAVLPVGYADGIPRRLSSHRNLITVNGQYVPIAGRICMDQMMIDVTDVKDVQEGDEVIIFPDMSEAARQADTISNELLSTLHIRK
ncbi:MAG: alanine racemase [Bulleidia sp.]